MNIISFSQRRPAIQDVWDTFDGLKIHIKELLDSVVRVSVITNWRAIITSLQSCVLHWVIPFLCSSGLYIVLITAQWLIGATFIQNLKCNIKKLAWTLKLICHFCSAKIPYLKSSQDYLTADNNFLTTVEQIMNVQVKREAMLIHQSEQWKMHGIQS